jgi:hypothetical protein
VKKILPVFLTIIVLLLVARFSGKTSADSSNNSQDLSIPPTSEGPGFFLPDSPFYFLDEIKQNTRLAFAVTPSQKAKTYSSVAGERVAELRFELVKNNIPAAEIAVRGIRENTTQAVKSVENAKLWGSNVENLAADINLQIKNHLEILYILETKATGELKAEVTVAITSLEDSKSKVEEFLLKEDAFNEQKDDLRRQTIRSARNAMDSIAELKNNLSQLQKQEEQSVDKEIQSKKSTSVKQKQDLSTALQAQALIDAQDISEKAQEIMNTIDITLTVNAPTPTPTPNK